MKLITQFEDAWNKCGETVSWFYATKKPTQVIAIKMNRQFRVRTKEGIMKGNKGDYLVQGIEGEVYPVKKRIFEKTYEVTK